MAIVNRFQCRCCQTIVLINPPKQIKDAMEEGYREGKQLGLLCPVCQEPAYFRVDAPELAGVKSFVKALLGKE